MTGPKLESDEHVARAGGGGLRPGREALRAAARPWVWVVAALALVLGGFGAVHANWEMFDAQPEFSLQGVDDTGYYLWLRSAVIDGDLDFANDVAFAPTLQSSMREEWLAWPRTPTGRVPNKYPQGWAIATAPAFLAGHLVAALTGQPTDGWSAPYFVAIWIYHLALATLGLWWAWRVVSRYVPEHLAAISVLALWIASPVIYYHTARVSMAHGLLFTLLAGIAHFSLAAQANPAARGRWWLIGALSGLAVLVRATAVVYLVFPMVVLAASLRSLPRSERWKTVAAFAVPGLCAALVPVFCNWLFFGRLLADPYATERFNWFRPAVFSSLLSPRHGLFYWHPLIFVGLGGLGWAMTMRAAPRVWALSIVAIVYLNSAWHAWWFGSSFGGRAYEGVVLFAMVGLGWCFARAGERRHHGWMRALGAVTVIAVTLGGVWFVLFVMRSIPREDAVTYRDLVAILFSTWR